MRLVIDLIRGKAVDEALTILHFAPKHAAKTAEKVLRSAIANIQNKDQGGRVDTSTLFVKEAFVDGGATMKRISPAPMGRAYRIRKRSNHVTIIVGQRKVAAGKARSGGTVAERAKAAKPRAAAKAEAAPKAADTK
jgi:large subunit ribosomal protein L22